MQIKTTIQVKGEFLVVSASRCLWITVQACICIKPTSPPSVLIPDLSDLTFLPAKLFHVQSEWASVFSAVTHRDGGTAVWFGSEKAELDTCWAELVVSLFCSYSSYKSYSLIFHHRHGSYPVCFFLWSSVLLITGIGGELRQLGPDKLLSISAVHIWVKWHEAGPPFLQQASFPDSVTPSAWISWLLLLHSSFTSSFNFSSHGVLFWWKFKTSSLWIPGHDSAPFSYRSCIHVLITHIVMTFVYLA